jgi:hypothetical protein
MSAGSTLGSDSMSLGTQPTIVRLRVDSDDPGSPTEAFSPGEQQAIADEVRDKEREIDALCWEIGDVGGHNHPGWNTRPANQKLYMTPGKLPVDVATCVRPFVRRHIEAERTHYSEHNSLNGRLDQLDESIRGVAGQMNEMHEMMKQLMGAMSLPWPPIKCTQVHPCPYAAKVLVC